MRTVHVRGGTPPAPAIGDIRICKDASQIRSVLGLDLFWSLHWEASVAMFPECPELAYMFPVLTFNTSERARLSFYESLAFDKPLAEAGEIRAWHRKLPEDGGELYRKACTIVKWAY